MAICHQAPFQIFTPIPTANPKPIFRCNLSLPSRHSLVTTEPEPLYTSVKAFALATVANLGPGFDFLGCAVDGLDDFVSLTVDPQVLPGEISISEISGDNYKKLSKNPLWNCAGIATIEVMKMLGIHSIGLSLSLEKGLPLGSGLGSGTANAAAAAVAVNEIFGRKFGVEELVYAGLKSEEKVSGYHTDNIAPALMGGFVLIQNYEPLDLLRLSFPLDKELLFVLVSPEFEAPTKKMRAALPAEIGMAHHVWNSSQAGALVAAVLQGTCICYIEQVGFSIAYTAAANACGVSQSSKCTILSIFNYGYACSQILGGWAAQKLGGRSVLLIPFVSWSLTNAFVPLDPKNVKTMVLAQLPVGVAQGFMFPFHTLRSRSMGPTKREV